MAKRMIPNPFARRGDASGSNTLISEPGSNAGKTTIVYFNFLHDFSRDEGRSTAGHAWLASLKALRSEPGWVQTVKGEYTPRSCAVFLFIIWRSNEEIPKWTTSGSEMPPPFSTLAAFLSDRPAIINAVMAIPNFRPTRSVLRTPLDLHTISFPFGMPNSDIEELGRAVRNFHGYPSGGLSRAAIGRLLDQTIRSDGLITANYLWHQWEREESEQQHKDTDGQGLIKEVEQYRGFLSAMRIAKIKGMTWKHERLFVELVRVRVLAEKMNA